jgi:hypothetical protein
MGGIILSISQIMPYFFDEMGILCYSPPLLISLYTFVTS